MALTTLRMSVIAIGAAALLLAASFFADLKEDYASSALDWPLSVTPVGKKKSGSLGKRDELSGKEQAARNIQNDYPSERFLLRKTIQAKRLELEAARLQIPPDMARAMTLSRVITTLEAWETAMIGMRAGIAPETDVPLPILLVMLAGEGKAAK